MTHLLRFFIYSNTSPQLIAKVSIAKFIATMRQVDLCPHSAIDKKLFISKEMDSVKLALLT